MTLDRRTFLGSAATALAAAAVPRELEARLIPTVHSPPLAGSSRSTPAVVASANGIRGVARAYEMLTAGADPLDAAIEGVKIQELDPADSSVGYGGLPNEEGVVQLDASLMHGPTKRAGAVAALEGIATPSLVAKAVMELTDHILLAGAGAKRFALDLGFPEQDLLTERSRQAWLRWRARRGPNDNWLEWENDELPFTTGTINLNAVDAGGDIGSVTTTSGLAWKVPGRVGDSPLIGAGQYCDNEVGAAGSTGRGEANIMVCGAFLTVEFMRQGHAPEEACLRTLQRVADMTEARLLGANGRPRFNLNFYAIAKDGRTGAAALYQGGRYAVADAAGARVLDSAYLFSAAERPG
jgi:N4-(beta-N-acetylglucosaminyl)-L-asparaginase